MAVSLASGDCFAVAADAVASGAGAVPPMTMQVASRNSIMRFSVFSLLFDVGRVIA